MGTPTFRRLEQRALAAVEAETVQKDEFMGDFYRDFWKPSGRMPTWVTQSLADQVGACAECGYEPAFDDFIGEYSDRRYCSRKCRTEAHDDEYSRQCEWCGDMYDSEQDGGWILERDVCSMDCAEDVVKNDSDVEKFCKTHPGVDLDATVEKMKEAHDFWNDDSREFMQNFEHHAVYHGVCGVCEAEEDEATDGRWIEDLDETWFCSDHCAWDGIATYLTDITADQWSPWQTQQFLKDYLLSDLEDTGALNAALRAKGIRVP